ncbi:MAG: MBL fold metallo-hydrolase [Pseudomonadota bacterium]
MLRLFWLVTFALLQVACSDEGTISNNDLVQTRGANKDVWWNALPRAAWAHFKKIQVAQSWFDVYEVAPGVLAINEPGQFEETISYLIRGSKQSLLLDSGLGIGNIQRLTKELGAKDPLLLNSSAQYDHIGGNHQFEKLLGSAEDFAQQRQQGLTVRQTRQYIGPGWVWRRTPAGFRPNEYRVKPYRIDRIVSDGDIIDLGDRQLEVLLTPSHSPDALCLLDAENGLLFSGDTFYPAALYTHGEGADFQAYKQSAARLANLNTPLKLILPAHNAPVRDPDVLQRLNQAFDTISDGREADLLTDGILEHRFADFSILVEEGTNIE